MSVCVRFWFLIILTSTRYSANCVSAIIIIVIENNYQLNYEITMNFPYFSLSFFDWVAKTNKRKETSNESERLEGDSVHRSNFDLLAMDLNRGLLFHSSSHGFIFIYLDDNRFAHWMNHWNAYPRWWLIQKVDQFKRCPVTSSRETPRIKLYPMRKIYLFIL